MDGDRQRWKADVIGGKKYTLVGVVGAPFVGVDLDAADIWIPLAFYAEGRGSGWWKKSEHERLSAVAASVAKRTTRSSSSGSRRASAPLVRLVRWTPRRSREFGSIVRQPDRGKRLQEVEVGVRLRRSRSSCSSSPAQTSSIFCSGARYSGSAKMAVRLALGIRPMRLIRTAVRGTLAMSLAPA
jgi:hypothetical protein